MALNDRLLEDLKEAMRRGDATARETIRLLRSALGYAEIEQRGPLSPEAEVAIVQREIKRRREAIEQYERAGRADRAAQEQAGLAILQRYLPAMLGEDEIAAAAREVIAQVGAQGSRDLGKVMGPLMARLRGRAEGATVNRIVRDLLGAG
ncbi:MAG: GatB/YqeY domain-containing protein [Chloroflexi bacterium]|nr:GatB/YqeY domain-containing protein [Chloroflexota bacterium]